MTVNSNQVRAKAKAFVDALAGMTARQREQEPSPHYVESYNQLLALAKEAAPNIDPRLWPSRVDYHPAAGASAQVKYVELHTYAGEILNLLPRQLGMVAIR
ncbi:hypothetical protein HMI49_13845 [Corallococcus exercitus]|uniref:Uncharacterized protein n=1 Tax=Corallococcus exercitus TaxID=2316736 RepID=A0A7Y4NR32_9BACT|nr:hypothetical protein [Corallococcus exercitus]NOK34280.1 hypothetical protein [Corallococcus exercitus]